MRSRPYCNRPKYSIKKSRDARLLRPYNADASKKDLAALRLSVRQKLAGDYFSFL